MTSSSAGARFRSALTQKNDNNQPLQIAGAINAYTAMMATQVGTPKLFTFLVLAWPTPRLVCLI